MAKRPRQLPGVWTVVAWSLAGDVLVVLGHTSADRPCSDPTFPPPANPQHSSLRAAEAFLATVQQGSSEPGLDPVNIVERHPELAGFECVHLVQVVQAAFVAASASVS